MVRQAAGGGEDVRGSELWAAARKRLEGVRPCYLGFGLFWAVSFATSFASTGAFGSPATGKVYALVGALSMVVAIAIAGALAQHRDPTSRTNDASRMALVKIAGAATLALIDSAAIALSVGGAFTLPDSPALAATLGLAGSVGSVGFLLAQQGVLASLEPARAATVGAASAALSAVGCVLILALPTGASRLVIEIAALIIATILQGRSVLVSGSLGRLSESSSARSDADIASERRRSWWGAARELWRPALCVTMFALVWKLSTRMAPDAPGELTTFTLLAFGLATLLLCAQALLSRHSANLLRTYRLLFPLMTGAFLLLPLLGNAYGPVLSAMLMFGFELVNLLLIFLCAQVAHTRRLPSSTVYALGLGPSFLAMLVGQVTGVFLEGAVQAQSVVHLSGIALAAVYLLSMALLVITRSGRRDGETGESPMDITQPGGSVAIAADIAPDAIGLSGSASLAGTVAPSAEEVIAGLAAEFSLTPREADIAAMVARGNSVPAIAERLAISQNTVRGHTKRIYAKLDIHTKQELIDLVAHRAEPRRKA